MGFCLFRCLTTIAIKNNEANKGKIANHENSGTVGVVEGVDVGVEDKEAVGEMLGKYELYISGKVEGNGVTASFNVTVCVLPIRFLVL